jgi:exosortase
MNNASNFKLLIAASLLAIWPVLSWYVTGTLDGSNDLWGLLAAATAIVVLVKAKPQSTLQLRFPLALPALLMTLYIAATCLGVLISMRAVLAFLTLAALASAWRLDKRIDLPLIALCMLALPLAATLQFYLGYPLRVLAGILSVALLHLNGIEVIREGTLLSWNGQLVSIDAPCSGVKMLWAGMYLTYTLAAFYRFSAFKTSCAILLGVSIVVVANAIRAAALFYVETGMLHLPKWSHETIGMITFTIAAGMIVWGIQQVKGMSLWPRAHNSAS